MISSVKSVAGLRIRRGGSRCRMPIGPSQRDRRARFSTGSIIPWCMFPGMMPALTANGRGHGCRPKPNGTWRRGGLKQAIYPWGDELTPSGEHRCNIWQGDFPDHNTANDGCAGTAPVHAFPANGYGLHNVAGNVWEWCEDYFSPRHHQTTTSRDPLHNELSPNRSLRGGSFLCNESYCNRYRVAARSSNTPESSSSNIGFRVIRLEGGQRK